MPDISADEPDLLIATDKVCTIILKAKQFEAKEAISDPDSGSNSSDDGMVDVLQDDGSDPVERELTIFINSLDSDERTELVALAWLGRGDNDLSGWETLRADARQEHPTRVAPYLLGMEMLAEYLEEGLSLFGESCSDGRLS